MSDHPYKPFEPDWTVSPGEMLAEALEDRGLNPFGLAGPEDPLLAVFGENLEAVRGILVGSAPVTAEIAAELERALDPAPSARFWLNAERIYQADLIRLGRGIRVCTRCHAVLTDEDECGWYYRVPVTETEELPPHTFMHWSGGRGQRRGLHRVRECDGRPHDVIVRDRDLMAELERARQCPYC